MIILFYMGELGSVGGVQLMASLVLVVLVVHHNHYLIQIFSVPVKEMPFLFPSAVSCWTPLIYFLSLGVCPLWTFHMCGNIPLWFISIILIPIHVLRFVLWCNCY